MISRIGLFTALILQVLGLAVNTARSEETDRPAPILRHAGSFAQILGSGTGIEEFLDAHTSPEFIAKRGRSRAVMILGILARRYHGRPARVEHLSLTSEGALLRLSNDRGEWAEYELFTQPGDPEQRIGGFDARIIPAPAGEELAGLNESQIIAALARFLKDETGRDRFSGTVILAREDQILYEESFGQASREQGTANTPDTLFRLASLTKMFTGLAISLLVENGRIAFEDPVGKFLADLPNRQIREQVTIHQLLTHTGGLNSFTLVDHHDDEPDSSMESATLREQVYAYAGHPLVADPGSRYIYSNAGPAILGLIVETLTGQSYAAYVREKIFLPGGMRTAAFDPDPGRQPLATGYWQEGDGGRWQSTAGMLNAPGGNPSGGAWGSGRDLLAFAGAITGGGLFGRQTIRQMTEGKVEITDRESYAYGWLDKRVNGMRFVGHTGQLPGWSADFSLSPESGYVLIVLCNSGNRARAVADRVRQMLSRAVPNPPATRESP